MASAGSGYSREGMSRAGSAASGHGREGMSRSGSAASGHGRETMSRAGSAASGHGRETMSRAGSAASGLGREGLSRAGSGGGDEAELDDAAQLTPLCEEALLRLLEARLANDQIYTWAGTALLSVNPARPLPLYAPQLARRYLQGARRTPHLYSVAATAYRWARDLGKDQCIVFTGETGSGKSECVRICVQLAVLAAGEGAGAAGGAGGRLAAAGTLLETCSHAASNTHHNASRAGQKLEIDIDFKGDIVGTRVTQFLLNTECMVSRQGRERNFHAFYQLLAGADAALLKRLKLTRWWRGYAALVAADDAGDEDDDADDARATHDANMYAHTQAAAVTLGREDWWAGVQKILAFLLKLGNVQLERTARVNAPQTYVVVNYQELEEACSLVGIEAGALGAYLGSFGSSWQRGVSALSRAIYRRVHAAACTATHAEGRHATLTLLELPGESAGTSGALSGAGGVDTLLSHYVRTRLGSALRQACVCACLTADSLPSVTHAGLEQMLDAISSRAGTLPARMYEAGDMLERDREMLESRMVDLFADAGEPVFRDLFSDKNAYSPVVPAVRALASSLAARAGGARVVCCVRRAALRHAHTRAASRLLELVSLHGCGWAECFTTEEFIQRYCCLIPRDQPRRCRGAGGGAAGGAAGGACAGAACGEGCAVRRAARAARLPLGKVAVEDDRVFIKTTALVWQLEEFRLRRVRACVRLLQRGVRAWRLRRRRRAVAVISTWWLSVARASYLLGLAARLDARHLSPLCRAWPPPPRAARTLLAEPAALLRALHHRWRCLLYRRALPQTHRNRFREKVTASALFLGRKASYPASVGAWFAGDYVRLRAAGAWRRGAGASQVLVFADACAAVGASGAARRVLLALTTAALLLLSPRSLRPRRTVSCSRLAALAVSPYHDDLLCVVLDDGASSDETEACSGASGRCDMLLRVRRLVEACSKLVLVAQHLAALPPRVAVAPAFVCRCPRATHVTVSTHTHCTTHAVLVAQHLAALPPRVAVAPAFVCRCPRATHVTVHCAATPESRIVRRGDTLHVLPPD